ncbi:hypothetical protein AGR5A_Cc90552 [Agrobacterium genomosp. 5 str. CFBP 6626]|nr:hypothetical protein AGR5A_Cc90552 [Agrobacterium genomosp. 5 str. CFBP 6626]
MDPRVKPEGDGGEVRRFAGGVLQSAKNRTSLHFENRSDLPADVVEHPHGSPQRFVRPRFGRAIQ